MFRIRTRPRSVAWFQAAAALLCSASRATPAHADLPMNNGSAFVLLALVLADAFTRVAPGSSAPPSGALHTMEMAYVVGQRTVDRAFWYQVATEDGVVSGWLPAADLQILIDVMCGTALG